MVEERDLIVLGEGTEFFVEETPSHLCGKTLADSGIGATTGLNVVAIRANGSFTSNPSAATELPEDSELVMIGTAEQRHLFLELQREQ
jgi:K+/H+ antiporter YhaU regulatory subunit KhtT